MTKEDPVVWTSKPAPEKDPIELPKFRITCTQSAVVDGHWFEDDDAKAAEITADIIMGYLMGDREGAYYSGSPVLELHDWEIFSYDKNTDTTIEIKPL